MFSPVSQLTKQIHHWSILPISAYFPFKSLWGLLERNNNFCLFSALLTLISMHMHYKHVVLVSPVPKKRTKKKQNNSLILAFLLSMIAVFSGFLTLFFSESKGAISPHYLLFSFPTGTFTRSFVLLYMLLRWGGGVFSSELHSSVIPSLPIPSVQGQHCAEEDHLFPGRGLPHQANVWERWASFIDTEWII